MAPKAKTDAERFWSHVNKTETCWLWDKVSLSNGGYGTFGIRVRPGSNGMRGMSAHRWSYEQEYGSIPEGMVLDHLCRTRNCVRPDHLEAVSPRENLLRGNTVVAHLARRFNFLWLDDDMPSCHVRTLTAL